jgi:hypothetical protein
MEGAEVLDFVPEDFISMSYSEATACTLDFDPPSHNESWGLRLKVGRTFVSFKGVS